MRSVETTNKGYVLRGLLEEVESLYKRNIR